MLFNPGEMMPTMPRSFSDPVMESPDRLQVSSSRSTSNCKSICVCRTGRDFLSISHALTFSASEVSCSYLNPPISFHINTHTRTHTHTQHTHTHTQHTHTHCLSLTHRRRSLGWRPYFVKSCIKRSFSHAHTHLR